MLAAVSRPPDPEDWLASEQPLSKGLVAELQRLKRRARARWLPVLVVAIGLTLAVVYKKSKKVKVKRAQVILAVTEGSMGDGVVPMPSGELRDYVLNVLLTNDRLLELSDEEQLVPERDVMGDDYAVEEVRDMFDVAVFRNYFLYEYSADAPRSARIAVVVNDARSELAWHLAHRLADMIKDAEAERRNELGAALAQDASHALDSLRAAADEIDGQVARAKIELGRALDDGEAGKAAALKVEVAELQAKRRRAAENILGLASLASADVQTAAIDRAGLGMTFEIVEENRSPDEVGVSLYIRAIQAAILFFAFLPVVAIVVGTFDPRIHDREDVERVGLPVLGHLPSFPGDRVGSLRARGVRGRRVPS